MQQRSLLGWALALAFSASVSCSGGGSSSGPQGFGLSCQADKDCSAYDLRCGAAATCVQCTGASDCNPADECSAGLCRTPVKCSDSASCASDQVCDINFHRCVECVTNKDCGKDLICRKSSCVDQTTCGFTSDCSAGLWCEMTQHVCVTCRNDDDCGLKQICTDNDCVPLSASGGKGSGGTSSTGGKANAGTDAGGTAFGGADFGGTHAGGTNVGGSLGGGEFGGTGLGGFGGVSGLAGASGSGGDAGLGGKGGNAGSGGATGCDCLGGEVCTPDLRCVPPTLIDDLEDCNDKILAIQGRKGDWTAVADSGINLTYGFTSPGSGWADQTCAAWATGGELTVNGPNTTFAFIGFRLNVNGLDQGLAYSLAAYSGLQIKLESDSSVQVVLKTTGGGYFQVTLTPSVGSNLRAAPFASMLKMTNSAETVLNLATVYEVQFSVTNPKSFGLAIHRVSLY